MNNDLINIRNWLTANKLSLNIAKTEYVLIGSRQKLNNVSKQPNVVIGDRPIERVRDCKILGVQIDESLTWEKHIDQIAKKISSGISAIRKLRNFANRDTLVSVYNAIIQPHFDYCCEVWDSLGSGLAQRLQKLQNRCARIIMHCKNEAGQSDIALHSLGWITLAERRARIKARLMFKILNNLAPKRLSNALKDSYAASSNYHLRNMNRKVAVPLPKTEFLQKSLTFNGAKLWNSLPNDVRNCETLASFNNLISSLGPFSNHWQQHTNFRLEWYNSVVIAFRVSSLG